MHTPNWGLFVIAMVKVLRSLIMYYTQSIARKGSTTCFHMNASHLLSRVALRLQERQSALRFSYWLVDIEGIIVSLLCQTDNFRISDMFYIPSRLKSIGSKKRRPATLDSQSLVKSSMRYRPSSHRWL